MNTRNDMNKTVIKKGLIPSKADEKITAWLFIAPASLCWLLWFLVPFAQSFYISFFDYNYATPETTKFVGLQNYINMFNDSEFISALINTLLFVAITVPFLTVISLFLAFIVNKKFRARGAFRSIYYLPYIISPVAVATVFMYLFVKGGAFAKLFSCFGFPDTTWIANIHLAMPFIGIMFVWQLVGFYMVYFLSGMQTIPTTVYEAADIDGANNWQKFHYVTIPLLRPTTYLVVTYAIIQAFQIFDQISAVTNGNLGSPAGATNTLLTYFYQNSFRYYKMGYGSAIATVLFVLILLVTLIQKRFSNDKEVY